MTAITAKLSSKGHVVIPQELRKRLGWTSGAELIFVETSDGVLLKSKRKKGPHTLANLIGFLQYDGPPISTEELCRPVDLNEEPNGTCR